MKYSRSAWLYITPISLVHLIHLCKVIHVSQEYINFDDFLDGRSSFFEDSSEVLDALMLWNMSTVLHIAEGSGESSGLQCEPGCHHLLFFQLCPWRWLLSSTRSHWRQWLDCRYQEEALVPLRSRLQFCWTCLRLRLRVDSWLKVEGEGVQCLIVKEEN